jgi:prevent-host-death family protein
MQTINIHEAKTHLSRFVDRASKGESFIIAKAGKPLVKLIPLTIPSLPKIQRLGFMAGQVMTPTDFDQMGLDQINQLFSDGV